MSETEDLQLVSRTAEETVGLTIEVFQNDAIFRVVIQGDASRTDFRIHWAINEWSLVPDAYRPPGTVQVDDLAVQTPLGSDGRIVIEFPVEECPSKVVFVVKEGEKWIHNGAGDFVAYLKPPGADDIIAKVIAAETEYDRWSLFNRVNMATSLSDAAVAAGPYGMGLMVTWLRLSSMKLLPWYKGSNYQSKDAAHAQKVLAQKMADLACVAKDPLCRLFARISLSTLPRGGGNGDDIRMGILHIMRDNGIREGHRPGIEDHFLESWHQKLHTNTTPEDITICEAYLAFLHSGDMGEFWRVAWENGGITPESLAAMDHPINPCPIHLPHLIGPFQHYLWILKTTHAGADLDVAYEMVRGHLDGELSWMIGDTLANRNEWWVPGKIVEIRHRLSGYWKGTQGCGRDILLLDIALDSYFRILVERMDKTQLSADDLINVVTMVLSNSCISSESDTLECSMAYWRTIFDQNERWSGTDWAKRALAAADAVLVSLEEFADNIASNIQPHADLFGSKCNIDENYILNFSEEVVRGQSIAVLGPLMQLVSTHLRNAADMGAWEIVSSGIAGPRTGKLKYLETLESIQGVEIPEPTIFIVDKLTGNEDIPANVECIITAHSTDVLSHIAIRARAQSVLLATCFDRNLFDDIASLAMNGTVIAPLTRVSVDGTGSLTLTECAGDDNGAVITSTNSSTASKESSIKSSQIITSKSWVLDQSAFEEQKVGGKALNIKRVATIASNSGNSSILTPKSLALPYGTYEKVLNDPINSNAKKHIESLQKKLDNKKSSKRPLQGIPQEVSQIRQSIANSLSPPPQLLGELGSILEEKNLDTLNESPENAWKAICHVWASVYNDRAWLSRQTMGIPDSALAMSVLLQELIPATYAFVLHTADPLTGESGKIHGEIVVGMGEALVGNMPGRALSFVCDTTQNGEVIHITTYPSKIRALHCHAMHDMMMARSDSNGEDLQDFAGAGLYSSVPIPMSAYHSTPVSYDTEPLIWNDTFRTSIIHTLSQIAQDIETACQSPQDIEGVVVIPDDNPSSIGSIAPSVHIVQTRPQILL